MPEPIQIFFSYAHEDLHLVHALRRHLVIFDRQSVIKKWLDRAIAPGTDWHGVIDERLKRADIILLFVSANFFDSNYCYDAEMDEALRRHDAGEARVIPIIVRPCMWETAPFAVLQVVPSNAKPLTTWNDLDEACLDAARSIMRVVEELNNVRASGNGRRDRARKRAARKSMRKKR